MQLSPNMGSCASTGVGIRLSDHIVMSVDMEKTWFHFLKYSFYSLDEWCLQNNIVISCIMRVLCMVVYYVGIPNAWMSNYAVSFFPGLKYLCTLLQFLLHRKVILSYDRFSVLGLLCFLSACFSVKVALSSLDNDISEYLSVNYYLFNFGVLVQNTNSC